MPDLLIVFQDDQSCFQLEHFAKQKGFRVKSSSDLSVAFKWLEMWRFDALFVDFSFSLEEQLYLAEKLWQKNLIAPLVCYDLNQDSISDVTRTRLFGAEQAIGNNAWKVITDALETFQPRYFKHNKDFNILVVDDLDSPRDIICMYIENLGFPVVNGVGSVSEALALLKQDPSRFSSVITDIKMPHHGGVELIEQLRADPRFELLPVIVLTAYGTLDVLTDALKAGASGFLVKPPRKRDLLFELGRSMRLVARKQSARMVMPEDLEQITQLLIDRGWN